MISWNSISDTNGRMKLVGLCPHFWFHVWRTPTNTHIEIVRWFDAGFELLKVIDLGHMSEAEVKQRAQNWLETAIR